MGKTCREAISWYGVGADATVMTHALFVGFVVWAEILILIGLFAGWDWVFDLTFRLVHFGAVMAVGAQDLLGITCPLTIWERQLRQRAGQAASETPFIGRLVHRLLMCHLSEQTQRRIRLAFAAVVLVTFLLVSPRWTAV